MKRHKRYRNLDFFYKKEMRKGLSLVEIVVASSILVVLLTGGYYAARSVRKVEKFVTEDSYVRERLVTVLDQFFYEKMMGLDPNTGSLNYYSLTDVANQSYNVPIESHPTIESMDVNYTVETQAPGWTPGGNGPDPLDSLKKVSLKFSYVLASDD